MTSLSRFARAIFEFVVGDDWRIALGVALALALTALMADAGLAAWWVAPAAVVVLLAYSTRRAAREYSHAGGLDDDG